ncbi:hypothetical protein NE237_020686 [Protea cynaroides]|uniref:Uncharacterized protein n=1 Tax=Protea cynaroides TaxID=273540 RepID=A0A9Q0H8W5_9MAGN|nr:hypothetical protein NE237_020686 [Protea cynaroides]
MKMVGFVMYGRPREFLSISNRLRSSLTGCNPTILLLGGTSGLLRRFHKLKRIDFVKFYGDSGQLIREVAFSRLNLEVLNLSKQRRFSIEGVKELGAKVKTLRILIYSGLCFLQDSDLVAITNSLLSFEQLDISQQDLVLWLNWIMQMIVLSQVLFQVSIMSQLIEHHFPALFGQMSPLSCHFHNTGRERFVEKWI